LNNTRMSHKVLAALTTEVNSDTDSSIKRYAEIQAIHAEAQDIRARMVQLNQHLRESSTFNGDPMLYELWKTQMEPVHHTLVEIDQFAHWAMDNAKEPTRIKTPSEVEVY
jgi:hypothetical protein